MSLNFPSVEHLMHSVLPIHGCATTFEDLLLVWKQVFSLDRLSVLWFDEFLGVGKLLRQDGDAQPSVETSAHFQSFKAFERHALVEAPGLQACTLPEVDGTPTTASFFLPDDFDLKQVPQAWLTTTARLARTALSWEHQQTTARLEAMAEYAAGAGHEINNPLGTITGRVGQLLKVEVDPEKRRMLEMIGAQAYRVRDMIGDSMVFARPPAPKLSRLSLLTIITEAITSVQPLLTGRNISVTNSADANLVVNADPTQLCIVVSEILKNSIKAITDSGSISIECGLREIAAQSWVCIVISDTGVGMTSEEWAHCLNPFYSGRQAGRGLGFGLAKSWRIIHQHKGMLNHSHTSTGTAFHICLPASP